MKPFYQVLLVVAALLGITLFFHFQVSPFGFNPTDDGFILSGAARILDGQIPHRDFITIRPAGSYYMHALWPALFNDYTVLVSRLVFWLQMAAIVGLWLALIKKVLQIKTYVVEVVFVLFTALLLQVHSFPPMVWHSVDALFFLSLGVFIIYFFPKWRLVGYLLLGEAVLFRQNMLLAVVPIVLILHDKELWKCLLMSAIPALCYALFCLVAGVYDDFLMQVFAYDSDRLFETFIQRFVVNFWFIAGLFFGLLLYILSKNRAGYKIDVFGFDLRISLPYLLLLGWVYIILKFSSNATFSITGESPFFMSGLLIGFISWGYYELKSFDARLKLGAIVAWINLVIAISIGYNTPALAAGLAFMYLFFAIERPPEFSLKNKLVGATVLAILAVLFFGPFQDLRRYKVYRDQSVRLLKHEVIDFIPGTKGIYTGPNMVTVMEDFAEAKKQALQISDTFSVVPHFTSFWIEGEAHNPMAIDWPQNVELVNEFLFQELLKKSDFKRYPVILQKFEMISAANEIRSPVNDELFIVAYVKKHFTKVAETDMHAVFVWSKD